MQMRLLLISAIILSVSFTFYLQQWVDPPIPVTALVRGASTNEARMSGKRHNETVTTKELATKPVLPLASSFVPGNSSYPRIAYLTYSHLNSTTRFDELIFPALELWHPEDEPYYIILSNMWEKEYQELITSHANFSKHEGRMHPVFVPCKEGKNPEVECCKQEKGILYMMKHFDYDWVVYLDDDNFIRSSKMREYLTNLPTDELMVGTSGPSARLLGIYGYLPQKSSYKCSRDKSYSYPWGQVVAYNRATLKHIHRGLQLNGLIKQCLEYNVYHDVGNAIFHWMYGLPEFWVRISDRPNEMNMENLGAHGIGRCKENRAPCPMDVISGYYNHLIYRLPMDRRVYTWRNATGFRTTSTFATYGDPSQWNTEWHTMPIADCLGPT